MKVSVIILNWNGRDMTAQCLDRLKHQTMRDFEVVLVENGSVDGSLEYFREKYRDYPGLTILPQPRNLGFDGGVTQGLAVARGEFVALLNNDALPDPDWLEVLLARMTSDQKIAICQPKVLQLPKSSQGYLIDTTGDYYNIWGVPHPRGRDKVDSGQFDRAEPVFSAGASAALYRKPVFDKLGWFDNEFFAYYEDVDISFRARLAGYEVWYEPATVVYHQVGGTSGKAGGSDGPGEGKKSNPFTRYLMPKNLWYVYLRNMPARLFWRYLWRFAFLQVLSWANAFRVGGWKLGWAHTRSVMRGTVMTPSMFAKRLAIQRTRMVSAEEIDMQLLRGIPEGVGPAFRKYFGWLMKGPAR
jgi:GT2 family glycosyltransferase